MGLARTTQNRVSLNQQNYMLDPYVASAFVSTLRQQRESRQAASGQKRAQGPREGKRATLSSGPMITTKILTGNTGFVL